MFFKKYEGGCTVFFKRLPHNIYTRETRTTTSTMSAGHRQKQLGYAKTFEFDVVVVFIILVLIPISIFMMQSKRSQTKRIGSFVLLGGSFLYLAVFEGVVRLRETERASEIGLRGMIGGGGYGGASSSSAWSKRKRRGVVQKSSSFSGTTVFTSEKKDKKTTKTTKTLQYFSLRDVPSENEAMFRDERIRESKKTIDGSIIAAHVEQRFSGGDAFFQEAFREYERVEKVKTARVSASNDKSAIDDDVGTVSVTSDGGTVLTPQRMQSMFPEHLSFRTVFVVRDPRDVITSSYLSIISTLEEWARTKRDDLDGSSFQSVMRNNLNAEIALDVEIVRFMSASVDVPFFTGLENAMAAEIEKSNGAYANAILSFAEAMLDENDQTAKNSIIFVKYSELLSANVTGFRKLSEFLRGDYSLEQSFVAASASLRKRAETEPFLIASLVSKNDDTIYRHKKDIITKEQEIITPPSIYKAHMTARNQEHFFLLGKPLLSFLAIDEDEDDNEDENLFADFDAVDGAVLNPW
jgi:hypothetical protein